MSDPEVTAECDPGERGVSECDPGERGVSECDPGERGVSECDPGERGVSVCDSGERGVSECDPGERGVSECDPGERGVSECDPGETGVSECDPGERGVSECDPGETGVSECDPGETGVSECDPGETGVSECDPGERGVSECDPGETGVSECDPGERGVSECDPGETGVSECDPGETGVSECDPGERGVSECDPGETGVSECDPGETGVSECDPGETGVSECDPGERGVSECDPGETGVSECDPGERGVSECDPGETGVSECDPGETGVSECDPGETGVSECMLLCHCCYEVLVNPTSLTCGHSFCRHCLAQWWESSRRTECPECRESWHGFPKVNILLRDAVEKHHQADVRRRREEIQSNVQISHSLLAFQRFGDDQAKHTPVTGRARSFYTGVFLTLTCISVVLLMYSWSSGGIVHDDVLRKAVSRWTVDDVMVWMEELGSWSAQYREIFSREKVNGRLLNLLGDDELAAAPFFVENLSHRRALLHEIHRIQNLGVKPPSDLWQFKLAHEGKSLFLVYALKNSPRLTLLLLYLFDYDSSFLPLIHTCCSPHRHQMEQVVSHEWVEPTLWQWAWFVVRWWLLPYELLAEFACDWLNVHYWTSRVVLVNAVLLSLWEGQVVWCGWSRGHLRTLPQGVCAHVWKMGIQSMIFLFLWPVIPQCVWNTIFYWGLYCSPAYNTHTLFYHLLHHIHNPPA